MRVMLIISYLVLFTFAVFEKPASANSLTIKLDKKIVNEQGTVDILIKTDISKDRLKYLQIFPTAENAYAAIADSENPEKYYADWKKVPPLTTGKNITAVFQNISEGKTKIWFTVYDTKNGKTYTTKHQTLWNQNAAGYYLNTLNVQILKSPI